MRKVNFYFAILIITLWGAAAATLIIHVANANVPSFIVASQNGSTR